MRYTVRPLCVPDRRPRRPRTADPTRPTTALPAYLASEKSSSVGRELLRVESEEADRPLVGIDGDEVSCSAAGGQPVRTEPGNETGGEEGGIELP